MATVICVRTIAKAWIFPTLVISSLPYAYIPAGLKGILVLTLTNPF